MPACRAAEAAIGFDGGGRALGRVGVPELHGYRYPPFHVRRRELIDLCERVDTAGEENLRLVDVPDAGDCRLIEQRIRDVHSGPSHDARDGFVGTEISGERIGPETA